MAGARAVAEQLMAARQGVLTGGTDTHLVIGDLRQSAIHGVEGEDRLASIGITVSRTPVPFDPRPVALTSGLRIGTPALATRGLQREDFAEVGAVIAEALEPSGFLLRQPRLAARVAAVAGRYPLYPRLAAATDRGVVLDFPPVSREIEPAMATAKLRRRRA